MQPAMRKLVIPSKGMHTTASTTHMLSVPDSKHYYHSQVYHGSGTKHIEAYSGCYMEIWQAQE